MQRARNIEIIEYEVAIRLGLSKMGIKRKCFYIRRLARRRHHRGEAANDIAPRRRRQGSAEDKAASGHSRRAWRHRGAGYSATNAAGLNAMASPLHQPSRVRSKRHRGGGGVDDVLASNKKRRIAACRRRP